MIPCYKSVLRLCSDWNTGVLAVAYNPHPAVAYTRPGFAHPIRLASKLRHYLGPTKVQVTTDGSRGKPRTAFKYTKTVLRYGQSNKGDQRQAGPIGRNLAVAGGFRR